MEPHLDPLFQSVGHGRNPLAGELSRAYLAQFREAQVSAHQRRYGVGPPAALHAERRIVSAEADLPKKASQGGPPAGQLIPSLRK